MLESTIEAYFVAQVKKRGGFCIKLNAAWNKGIPDRLAIMPEGVCLFVELKQVGGRLSATQNWYARALRALNQHYFIIKNKEQIDDILRPWDAVH